jgi:hypothetical protein
MRKLTQFEESLVRSVLLQNPKFAPLGYSVSSLEIERVKTTGVGAYITFSRNNQVASAGIDSTELGFNGLIYVPGVPSGLGCVIDVDNGQLNHIELFTYGDELWDGSTEGARIVSSDADSGDRGQQLS